MLWEFMALPQIPYPGGKGALAASRLTPNPQPNDSVLWTNGLRLWPFRPHFFVDTLYMLPPPPHPKNIS